MIWPRRGYFPEPQEHNRATAEIPFKYLGFTIIAGTSYLGGFIGSAEDQSDWVSSKISDWSVAIREISEVVAPFAQSAYARLQKYGNSCSE
jgi:hypothetical protein